ncbi:hypothetical protein FRC02_012300 [Tulasnella sp. 418]|nr:hypothetical protein FRC02_012300 [Tulasnella sp. 418]
MSNPPSSSPGSPSAEKGKDALNAAHESSTSNSKALEEQHPTEGTDDVDKEGGEENGEQKESKGDEEEGTKDSSPAPATNGWQAIWSPSHNAYYFFNSRTNETTWTNPLVPPPTEGSSGEAGPSTTTSSTSQQSAQTSSTIMTEDALDGIDPALAYLDPNLYELSRGKGNLGAGQTFQARFNSRTGRFTAMNDRDPSHLSEYARAQRMSEVFFDVHKWEEELASGNAGDDDGSAGEKRKRPTKKDMERFKEQKRQKKLAKTAWLRN